MSNNNQDQPDDYDAIFDSSTSEADNQTTIEVSDGDEIKSQDYIDVEELEIPTSEPKEYAEGEEGDIEEGIFAPARNKERPAGKKTAPLMWAVSLLAFVGVGSFVYVSNPDIIAKMTQNMGSEDITVANTVPSTDPSTNEHPADVASTPVAATDPAITPVSQPSSDVVTPTSETATEPMTPPADLTSTNPSDVVMPTATTADPTVATNDTTTIPSPTTPPVAVTSAVVSPSDTAVVTPTPVVAPTPSAEVAPTLAADDKKADATKADITPPSMDVATEAAKTAAVAAAAPTESKPAEVVTPIVKDEKAVAPSDMGVTPPTEGAKTVTAGAPTIEAAPDVIAPTNELEDAPSGTAAQPTTTVAAPAAEVTAKDKTAEELAAKTKTEKETAAKEKPPVVAMSKEEKKRLDDAKLDQYFDSPGGHILSMIPAPSMNPKKGSNESIIIVNKKGSKAGGKTTTAPAPQSKNVVIETTTLDTQLVSANRALRLGRYEAAKEMYDDLYKLSPKDAKVLAGRAIVLQKMGLPDQAIGAYEELLKTYPDNADAIVNWSGLIRKQYPAVALSKLLDLHMAQPENNVVTAQLGVANADAGNYADAVRYLGDAAAAEPKNPLHFYNLAVVSEKAGNRQQAVTYYEKALEVDAIYGDGQNAIPREKIYDRLSQIRGN